MRPLDGTGLKRLHRSWRHRSEGRVALILDNVQSPFNVGAIVRTAAAYRVDHLWLVGATPELDAAKVRTTALGCERYLTWERADAAGIVVATCVRKSVQLLSASAPSGKRPALRLKPAPAPRPVLGTGARQPPWPAPDVA